MRSVVRRYAAGDATVLTHLAITLAIIGERVAAEERAVLSRMLDEIDDGASARIEQTSDRRRVTDATAHARRRLASLGGSAP